MSSILLIKVTVQLHNYKYFMPF